MYYLFLFLLFIFIVWAVINFFIAYFWWIWIFAIIGGLIFYWIVSETEVGDYTSSDSTSKISTSEIQNSKSYGYACLYEITFEKPATTTEKAKFRALFKQFFDDYYEKICQEGKKFGVVKEVRLNDYELYEVYFYVRKKELNLKLNGEIVLSQRIKIVK